MFCSTCGAELAPSAKFCSGCGASMGGSQEAKPSVDLKNPVIAIRPVFVPWVSVVSVLPLALFFSIWGGGFLGIFLMKGLDALGLSVPFWASFVICGLVTAVGIPYLVYLSKKRTYEQTEYKFYADRLEYAEGFWTAEKKTIKYDKITETNLKRGMVQKKYNLGSIILSTPATSNEQGKSNSGIKILDIENAEEIYEKVQHLIG